MRMRVGFRVRIRDRTVGVRRRARLGSMAESAAPMKTARSEASTTIPWR